MDAVCRVSERTRLRKTRNDMFSQRRRSLEKCGVGTPSAVSRLGRASKGQSVDKMPLDPSPEGCVLSSPLNSWFQRSRHTFPEDSPTQPLSWARANLTPHLQRA